MGKMLEGFKILPLKMTLCIPIFTIHSAKCPVNGVFFWIWYRILHLLATQTRKWNMLHIWKWKNQVQKKLF